MNLPIALHVGIMCTLFTFAGQCHAIDMTPLRVESSETLTVGTEEHDSTSENDSWFVSLAAADWYTDQCDIYEVWASKVHEGEKKQSFCWNANIGGQTGKVSISTGVKSCTEWTTEAQAFEWILRVEPDSDGSSDPDPVDPNDSSGSCMSGNTGLIKVNTQKTKSQSSEVTKLIDLEIGDSIRGYDEFMRPSTCKVEAIGQFGFGPLYGNYTDDHFIYNPTNNMIEEHGKAVASEADMTRENKYEILTDCPLAQDEAGTRFTPIDKDFCGEETKSMSWSDYVLLHKGILRVVRETGGFWFSQSAYPDFDLLQRHAPSICKSMLKCLKDHDDCQDFEMSSIVFIETVLSDAAKVLTFDAFHNIGRHRELGSVSATVSGGGSIRE